MLASYSRGPENCCVAGDYQARLAAGLASEARPTPSAIARRSTASSAAITAACAFCDGGADAAPRGRFPPVIARGGLGQEGVVAAVHRGGPAAGGQLHQSGPVRHPPVQRQSPRPLLGLRGGAAYSPARTAEAAQ